MCRKRPRRSVHENDTAVGEIVDGADDAELLFVDGAAQNRRCRLHPGDGGDNVLSNCIVELIAWLIACCIDRRRESGDKRRQMPREGGAARDRFDGCLDSATRLVAKDDDER
jgi:hypothetical protein